MTRVNRNKLDFFFGVFFLLQSILFLSLESTTGMLDRQGRVRGRDFLQFYMAGRIVAQGEAPRLYDQEYFLEVQQSLVDTNDKCPPYLSIYPPNVALLFSPLARLPYPSAILVWWSVQAACFLGAGCLLFRELNPPPGWRHTAWLGMLAFYPLINTFWNGQLAALFLLVLVIGLELRRRNRPILGGIILSLVALKPQFAAGVALWLVLRRDLRSLGGFGLGLLLQALTVATLLTPSAFTAFAGATRLYTQHFSIQQFTPDHQHAVAGIIINLFGKAYSSWAMLTQLFVIIIAGTLLVRIDRPRHPEGGLVEASAGVLFTLLSTPHLLTYDLTYILIPTTYLLSLQRSVRIDNINIIIYLLYVTTTLTPLYSFSGFSIVPIVLLWALHALSSLSADPKSSLSSEESREHVAGSLPGLGEEHRMGIS
jgi:hypothetical protein